MCMVAMGLMLLHLLFVANEHRPQKHFSIQMCTNLVKAGVFTVITDVLNLLFIKKLLI